MGRNSSGFHMDESEWDGFSEDLTEKTEWDETSLDRVTLGQIFRDGTIYIPKFDALLASKSKAFLFENEKIQNVSERENFLDVMLSPAGLLSLFVPVVNLTAFPSHCVALWDHHNPYGYNASLGIEHCEQITRSSSVSSSDEMA